jgi:ribosomal protein L11 methyltransferase
MAFGTGSHATTRGCLEFIETVAGSLNDATFTALDVGTGSGILAIALAKLGAKKVWAVDSDPVALKVARGNVCTNGVEKKVELSGTAVGRMRKSFAVVVANLTAETIVNLASALEKTVAPKGFLILSGILNPKAKNVIRSFSTSGFKSIRRRRKKGWTTLLLQRN